MNRHISSVTIDTLNKLNFNGKPNIAVFELTSIRRDELEKLVRSSTWSIQK